MTRGRKPLVDTTNEYLGNANPVTIGEIGRGDVDEIEVVKSVSKAEKLAFMEEPVTIVVMSSGDQNEVDLVQVAVNGITQFMVRKGVFTASAANPSALQTVNKVRQFDTRTFKTIYLYAQQDGTAATIVGAPGGVKF